MTQGKDPGERRWFQTTFGLILFSFLMFVIFLLVAEHRAHAVIGTWLIWLLPLACLVLHFSHGGHGGTSKENDHGASAPKRPEGSKS